MHARLQAIIDDFRAATERLRRLAAELPAEHWAQRADPDRWSVSENVAHLNLSSVSYLKAIRQALEAAPGHVGPAPAGYRHDPFGWLLWRTMGPPVRMRVRAPAAFIPQAEADPAELVREFERLQVEQIACVEAVDGMDLRRLRVTSPFSRVVTFNLYSALSILPRHQHRHLWQAEQVMGQVAGASVTPRTTR